MERIGCSNLIGNTLSTAVDCLRFRRFFQLAAEIFGYVSDLCLVRKRRKEALSQDVVNLIGGEVDRRDAPFLAAKFRTCVFECAIDEPGARIVGRREIGNDDANVFLLARRCQQVGEGARGDVRHRAVAHLLGVEVVEVRWHLIEQNENGLITLKELQPVLLVRRFGTARPECFELIPLAELVGDLAPEEVVWVIAAVEGGGISAREDEGVGHSRAICFTKRGVLGEQTEANK
jgi:hypothetical protein